MSRPIIQSDDSMEGIKELLVDRVVCRLAPEQHWLLVLSDAKVGGCDKPFGLTRRLIARPINCPARSHWQQLLLFLLISFSSIACHCTFDCIISKPKNDGDDDDIK